MEHPPLVAAASVVAQRILITRLMETHAPHERADPAENDMGL
jgi:hypothetical protein